jgi:hypothetical protein
MPSLRQRVTGTAGPDANRALQSASGRSSEVLSLLEVVMSVQVDIASVRNVFLGDRSMQVGGTPMKIGKAAAPYGAGRVISLFAHQKYDTLTLEYVDSNGGVHGAIFQLKKGQGELVRDELVARGVPDSGENPTKQSTSEVTHADN